MELTKIEADLVVQRLAVEANDTKIHELDDLQLVLVGGGIGDPVAI